MLLLVQRFLFAARCFAANSGYYVSQLCCFATNLGPSRVSLPMPFEPSTTHKGSKNASVETRSFNIILLGGTGAGKSTLVNTMVNFFRGAPELFKRLPAVTELKVAVPTAFLAVTEEEGKKAKELNVKDRKTQRQMRNCLAFAKTIFTTWW